MTAAKEANNVGSTIGYYDRNARAFADGTAQADVSGLLHTFTELLPEGAAVLDWGCGTGRDSRAMLDMGFHVISTDASVEMCRTAKELFNVDARCERFEELNADCAFDGIWACASLLHIPKQDLPATFATARRALKPSGILYASFKYGAYEGWRNGRWFTDLDEADATELAGDAFRVLRIWTTADVRPGREEELWLNCLLRKRS